MNINYRQLLQRHQSIRVPMIQRDYAQGRPLQAEVREAFLDALQMALEGKTHGSPAPLNLDFVYGSVEKEPAHFSLLDGQQRLTTLFLLHWYLAWRDDRREDFTALFCNELGRSRFSYQVRESSNEFFNELVAFRPADELQQVGSLSALLTDQKWYFRYWRLDPTIQSVLHMLDAIHQRFKNSRGLFERLISDENPAITFQLLDLNDFKLSDDLYIKMNARGKPLTGFENFKALYERVLTGQFEGQTRSINGHDYSVKDFVALKMDTAWADFFWVHRDPKTNSYDDAIVNLLRLLALITRQTDAANYLDDAKLLRDEKKPPSYAVFAANGWLDEDFTESLIALLEPWSTRLRDDAWLPLLPDAHYFDEAAIFAKLARDAVSLTLPEVTQFAAYLLFLKMYPETVSADVLQEWMRVVRNLTANSDIERNTELQSAMRGVYALLPAAPDILAHLRQLDPKQEELGGFREQQLQEESLKAGLLLAHEGWRTLITDAENHGYFRGQIEFLCAFSGASEEWARNPDPAQWGEALHLRLQTSFAEYLARARAMFHEKGLQPLPDFRWERALLARGDYFLHTGQKTVNHWSFLVSQPTEPGSWKRLLRAGSEKELTRQQVAEKRDLLRQLWKDLSPDQPLPPQLDAFIAAAKPSEPWMAELIRTPAAFAYCQQRMLRWGWETDPSIYLLSQSQTNFRRAELFTYGLDIHTLRRLHADGQLHPLTLAAYQDPAGQDNQPHALLHLQYQGHRLDFRIEYGESFFYTWIEESLLEPFPELRSLLYEQAGFLAEEKPDGWSRRKSSPSKIEADLVALAKLLGTFRLNPR